jgi:hypothetical protein
MAALHIRSAREAYERFRAVHSIRESVVLVAEDFSVTRETVCLALGLSDKYAKNIESTGEVKGAVNHPAFRISK